MNHRNMFAFRAKRSVAFYMPKNVLRVCYAGQENLSIKGMDSSAQRDSLPGFPL